jgi:hypothetical protein
MTSLIQLADVSQAPAVRLAPVPDEQKIESIFQQRPADDFAYRQASGVPKRARLSHQLLESFAKRRPSGVRRHHGEACKNPG